MVLLKAIELPRSCEAILCRADTLKRAVLNESLGGLRNDSDAAIRIGRCNRDGHTSTDAMTEHKKVLEFESIDDSRESAMRFLTNKIKSEKTGISVRSPEAQPIVSDYRTTGCLGKLKREVTPKLDAS